ncbi:MAG: DUF1326 domain-containing protein [Nitrospirales bacterium]
MSYRLKGRLLEVCDCEVLCPCWVGEDPDNGTCNTAIAWHVDSGTVDEIDVSGYTIGLVGHVPGNILHGNIRAAFFVDDRATDQQQQALIQVFTGKLGGPAADFAQLFGEIVEIMPAPITFDVQNGKGHLRIGESVEAKLDPLLGQNGQPTTIHNSIFSTIPGAPAYVGKAPTFKVTHPILELNLDIHGHNAIQGYFLFEG